MNSCKPFLAFTSNSLRILPSRSLSAPLNHRIRTPRKRNGVSTPACWALSNADRRLFHTSKPTAQSSPAPKHTDRGPVSEEDTQTDFSKLDVLNGTVAPSTSIDACLDDGFQLNSGLRITGGSGVLLIGGEAFTWRPFHGRRARMINHKGQWECDDDAWGLLDLVWPKPDLLILGLGPHTYPISPRTRDYLNSLGIRVDIQDTRNASAQFNLLATERGIGEVAAAMLPMGWKD